MSAAAICQDVMFQVLNCLRLTCLMLSARWGMPVMQPASVPIAVIVVVRAAGDAKGEDEQTAYIPPHVNERDTGENARIVQT